MAKDRHSKHTLGLTWIALGRKIGKVMFYIYLIIGTALYSVSFLICVLYLIFPR